MTNGGLDMKEKRVGQLHCRNDRKNKLGSLYVGKTGKKKTSQAAYMWESQRKNKFGSLYVGKTGEKKLGSLYVGKTGEEELDELALAFRFWQKAWKLKLLCDVSMVKGIQLLKREKI